MTNQEILTKAIQKAIDGGWKTTQTVGVHNWLAGKDTWIPVMSENGYKKITRAFSINDLIFNHDFAKALWPGYMPYPKNLPTWAEPAVAWKSHLKNMVISEDPIAYLGANLPQ